MITSISGITFHLPLGTSKSRLFSTSYSKYEISTSVSSSDLFSFEILSSFMKDTITFLFSFMKDTITLQMYEGDIIVEAVEWKLVCVVLDKKSGQVWVCDKFHQTILPLMVRIPIMMRLFIFWEVLVLCFFQKYTRHGTRWENLVILRLRTINYIIVWWNLSHTHTWPLFFSNTTHNNFQSPLKTKSKWLTLISFLGVIWLS